MPQQVRVGVGVYVFNEHNQVLLGLRQNSHGANTWCPPGGHLEFGETPEICARREVMEEAGIEIQNIRPLFYTNDIFDHENKHYLTLQFKADYQSGNVQIMEPDKCLEWKWYDWDNVPAELFLSVKQLREQLAIETVMAA